MLPIQAAAESQAVPDSLAQMTTPVRKILHANHFAKVIAADCYPETKSIRNGGFSDVLAPAKGLDWKLHQLGSRLDYDYYLPNPVVLPSAPHHFPLSPTPPSSSSQT
jgi:hypothetical protein